MVESLVGLSVGLLDGWGEVVSYRAGECFLCLPPEDVGLFLGRVVPVHEVRGRLVEPLERARGGILSSGGAEAADFCVGEGQCGAFL